MRRPTGGWPAPILPGTPEPDGFGKTSAGAGTGRAGAVVARQRAGAPDHPVLTIATGREPPLTIRGTQLVPHTLQG